MLRTYREYDAVMNFGTPHQEVLVRDLAFHVGPS